MYGPVSTTVETNYTDFNNPIVDPSYVKKDVDDSSSGSTGGGDGVVPGGANAAFGGFVLDDPSKGIQKADDDRDGDDFSEFDNEFATEGE